LLPTRLLGEATVSFLEEESALCNLGTGFLSGLICSIAGTVVNSIVSVVIDVNTELTIEIAPEELQLRYVSPFTQN
jgi:hypothetical protein